MAEMNRISRFFVNRSSARRGAQRYRWIRENATVPERSVCLEIGCGSAEFAARFVEGLRPARYVATDIDPRQLEEAARTLRKRFPGGSPASLEVKQADMLELPFPDATFDVVLAFVALHHASASHLDFSQVPRALSEVDRVLRPGGLLVYSELFHKEGIRTWLTEHAYIVATAQRRFRLESVVARKRPDLA